MNSSHLLLIAGLTSLLVPVLACSPGAPDSSHGATTTIAELEDSLRARIAEVPGAAVGLVYLDPARNDTVAINADSSFHAASTMKVPVLIELFRWHDEGLLDVDATMALRNEFRSALDGSTYSLPNDSDSDSSLYARIGTPVQLSELARLMIVRSSNLATNALIDTLGAERIQQTTDSLGAGGMRVLRGVEDLKAYEAGLSNSTTARALANLFLAIEEGRAGTPGSTKAMLDILLAQEFNDQIPAGLPAGTPVAHKTGSITAIMHDAGIVYPEGRDPYILVVLTGGIRDPAVSKALTAELTRLVHRHATR